MKKNISHPKKCSACNRDVTRVSIQYDYLTLKPYCNRPSSCNPKLRPSTLIEGSEGLDQIIERTPFSKEVQAQLEEFIPRSQAFRMTPEQAIYLVQYASKHQLYNVNQIIQHIISYTMQNQPIETVPARNPIIKSASSGFNAKTKQLQEEVEYYKEAAQKLEKPPAPLRPEKPKPKPEQPKKDIAFRL